MITHKNHKNLRILSFDLLYVLMLLRVLQVIAQYMVALLKFGPAFFVEASAPSSLSLMHPMQKLQWRILYFVHLQGSQKIEDPADRKFHKLLSGPTKVKII